MICHSNAQNGIWSKTDESRITVAKIDRGSTPTEYSLFTLNLEALKGQLQSAPSRDVVGQESNVIVSFPNSHGELQDYKVYEAAVLDPALAARYTDIKTYVGKGIDDKTAVIRFSVTLFGLHTMTFSGIDGISYINPYTKDLQNYIVYNRANSTSTRHLNCGTVDQEIPEVPEIMPQHRANNSLFKTYRLALACTIEYAAYHVSAAGLNGGTLAQKKAAVLAAMAVTMTRVNGVYERDMALTMVIIANDDLIINITSDSYDNANTGNILLTQNQTQIDNIIGTASYDIGHVFSTGGGGVALQGSPCTSVKAQGVTGTDSPVGDDYDIDFVAHEMGHQFGCSHTFNSDQGNCGGTTRVTSSAYEPGSGTTIMAYAGICAPDDVQPHSDAYFHARSIIQMIAFINGTGNCGVVTAILNTPPVVSAGGNYTIPFGTAFALTGTATDAQGDALTYCWEQYNFQISNQPPENTSTTGPNFRSLSPSASPTRYFPKFTDVIANNLVPTWEVIPSVARPLLFSLVVRDNHINGGQTERATATITLASTGPFKVTSQTAVEGWAQNSSQTITWDVAGSNVLPINTAAVNIKLSTNGGLTFPITLVSNTSNDGSEVITVPNLVSQTCRILIEAVGNVYYAVNKTPFYIGYSVTSACSNYTYSTPFALPFGTGYTTRIINVPTAGTISDVNVTINATHPNLQNLVMAMSHAGPLLTYFNQQCAGNSNMDVIFDSQGGAFTCASPTVGTYAPPTGADLNTFNGSSQLGNWTFGFKDLVSADSGTINSINLQVCTQTVQLLANAAFEFENFSLYPNPNNGNFTVQFNTQSSSKIKIAVHDIRGRKIFDKEYGNTGLFSQNLQLEHAQSGVYMVTITDGSKKVVKRIVKQ